MVVVRSVVGEDNQFRLIEDRLLQSPNTQAGVGLLIGKLYPNLDRGFVYHLVPTPLTDSGLPPCDVVTTTTDKKKAQSRHSESGSPIHIDTEWVAEHACQVSRMLLGGMDVVGIYIWASENSFKASTPILCQTVKAVAHATKLYHDNELDERLVIHISSSPRRWTCKTCSLNSSNMASNLRPCDFKLGKLLASLQSFRCTFNFEIRLPIFHEQNSYVFKDVIQIGISLLSKELKSAKALIDGNLVTEDLQLTAEEPHEVELLSPFLKEPPESCTQAEVLGLVSFSGVVCAWAYLVSKVHISQVISDIKGDIIASLQSRLDIFYEELEGDSILAVDDINKRIDEISVKKSQILLMLHEMRNRCNLLFPRRVLIPWLPNVFVCDYLKQFESFEDLKLRCKEMMSMEVSTEKKILEPEKEGRDVVGNSFWSFANGNSVSAADQSKKNVNQLVGSKGHGRQKAFFNLDILVITIVILLLSILTGGFISYSRGNI